MKCPNCEHENVAEARFCDQCATPLDRACAACGSPASSVAKFCSQCGSPLPSGLRAPRFASPTDYTPQHLADKILAAKANLEGERKQVTVLFADITGSMNLFVDHDAEAAQKILDPVLNCMIEAVHHYEGTVNRVMGDGILALFGAPIAHEDHASRACYAALRMQENVKRHAHEMSHLHGAGVTIRVGLNSGEIIVCAVGKDLHLDYTVVGQTANLAARLEQMAEPGTVLTSADTLRLVEGHVRTRSLGLLSVKGLPGSIHVYEVTGAGEARTRLQVAAAHGFTRFVGRDVELQQLRRVQRLAGDGHGHVVAIAGEAGVGKSRLVHEFVHSRDTTGWLILESTFVSYNRATPYLLIKDLLRSFFEINANDGAPLVRQKVTEKLLEFDELHDDAIPPVLDLLGALEENDPFRSLDAMQRRRYTHQAIVRIFLWVSRVQPIIVVIEDLHWNDSLSLGLLGELVVAAEHARLLLVVSFRPDYKDEWRNRPNYRQIRLDPLGSEGLTDFLQALLGPDPSLATLSSFVAERASGNPFFAEEIVRGLVDTGTLEGQRGRYHLAKTFSSAEIPPTVHAVLAARIDALPPGDKYLLQEAAVIGRDVPFALLREICGLVEDELRRLLDNLQASEFLYTTRLFPDPQFSFKHALTHDVAYGQVLRELRRNIHALVVSAIEKLYSDRLSEHAERLAHHAVRAELKEKAARYLRQAGAKAISHSALLDAQVYFEDALRILDTLPESKATLEQAFDTRLELRSVLRQLGKVRQMLEQLREAEATSERLNDDLRRGRVCAFMTTTLSSLGELDEALVTGTRAVEIAQRVGDFRLNVITKSCLEEPYYYRGEYQRAVEIAIENLAAPPAEWPHDYHGLAVQPSVFGYAWLIMSLAELGRFAEAAKYEAEAIRLAESTEHAYTISWAHFAANIRRLLKRDWPNARSLVEHWIAKLRTGNTVMLLPWAVASSAWVLAQAGEAKEALSRVREAEQLLERQMTRGIVGHQSWGYHAVGRACLLLGQLDEARRLGDCSLESSQGHPGFEAHALHLLADIASNPDRLDAEGSAAHYRQALAIGELHGMRPLAADCHLGLGKLYSHIGKPEHARENLTVATTMYREMDVDVQLEQKV